MGTKYITIPFDLGRAKRISSGEEQGKIVTRDGRNVRIVCWDVKCIDPILALLEGKNGIEYAIEYQSSGKRYISEENADDLFLSVPEWTAFKDGDIVSFGIDGISIIKELDYDSHSSYFTLIGDSGYFNDRYWINDNMRKASEDEKNKVFNHLKSSIYPLAKEYLKRFFGIEDNKEYKFEPKQWVLCKGSFHNIWTLCQFSHIEDISSSRYVTVGGNCWAYCIPYNEETKHLIGTSEDWEG